MFSQELLTSGELNHFSLKERMVEIGKRWHKLSPSHKDKYKRQVEEQQADYKLQLENWVKVRWGGGVWGDAVLPYSTNHFHSPLFQSLSPQDRAVYKEFSTSVSWLPLALS